MHAGMDEPELLMRLLETIANEKARGGGRSSEWQIVSDHVNACLFMLEKANETPRR